MFLQFSALPVRSALKSVKLEDYKAIRTFLNLVNYSKEEAFCDSWSQSLIEFNKQTKTFNDSELDLLISFGNSFGNSSIAEQIELIEMTSNYFNEYEKAAGEEFKKSGKLKVAIPIYAGVIVCILII